MPSGIAELQVSLAQRQESCCGVSEGGHRDHGTGWSSLAFLQNSSTVELKLDRASMLRLAGQSPAGAAGLNGGMNSRKQHRTYSLGGMLEIMDEDASRQRLQDLLRRAMTFSAAGDEVLSGPEHAAMVARLEQLHRQATAAGSPELIAAVRVLLDDLAAALAQLAAAQDRLASSEAAAVAILIARTPPSKY